MKLRFINLSLMFCLSLFTECINTAFAEDDVCVSCVKSCAEKNQKLEDCKLCCISDCALKEECSSLEGNCEEECSKVLKH